MNSLIIDGAETNDPHTIKGYVTEFYDNLYNHNRDTTVNDVFANMFTVNEGVNQTINSDITVNELWNILRSLKATTPGPDGMSNTYLKKLWDIIGPLIV
jgi:hypothetical protein